MTKHHTEHAHFCQVVPYRDALRTWLADLSPDHFVTLTFAETACDYRATRAVQVWFTELHKCYNPCAAVYVVEPHPGNPEAHHIHALVKYQALFIPRHTEVRALWRWGYSRVYDCNGGAARYVGKYIAQKTVPDWGILGDLSTLTNRSNQAIIPEL